ncbi:hypothetical protein D9757_004467 [Collybiopsis confluens]|uniref:Uncharacterized protein n=1 Tax=Collybiopsis confluens TaxID=2823264 RepID=A0A8H5HWQ9_9AGAR|nr:hypothetical protein D9757_004467 [Collybiopsis confluens]
MDTLQPHLSLRPRATATQSYHKKAFPNPRALDPKLDQFCNFLPTPGAIIPHSLGVIGVRNDLLQLILVSLGKTAAEIEVTFAPCDPSSTSSYLSPARAKGFGDIKIPSHYYYGSPDRHTYGWDEVNLQLDEVDRGEVEWGAETDGILNGPEGTEGGM